MCSVRDWGMDTSAESQDMHARVLTELSALSWIWPALLDKNDKAEQVCMRADSRS